MASSLHQVHYLPLVNNTQWTSSSLTTSLAPTSKDQTPLYLRKRPTVEKPGQRSPTAVATPTPKKSARKGKTGFRPFSPERSPLKQSPTVRGIKSPTKEKTPDTRGQHNTWSPSTWTPTRVSITPHHVPSSTSLTKTLPQDTNSALLEQAFHEMNERAHERAKLHIQDFHAELREFSESRQMSVAQSRNDLESKLKALEQQRERQIQEQNQQTNAIDAKYKKRADDSQKMLNDLMSAEVEKREKIRQQNQKIQQEKEKAIKEAEAQKRKVEEQMRQASAQATAAAATTTATTATTATAGVVTPNVTKATPSAPRSTVSCPENDLGHVSWEQTINASPLDQKWVTLRAWRRYVYNKQRFDCTARIVSLMKVPQHPQHQSYQATRRTVTINFNSLSRTEEQIRQKVGTFTQLLDQSRNAGHAYLLALNCIADRWVSIGVAQLKPGKGAESCYTFGRVAAQLCQRHPPLFDVLLGFAQEVCPYVAPMLPLHKEGQSVEEYRSKALKYKENETFQGYVDRMSGAMRLFTALLVSPVNNQFPYISYAWEWLVDFVQLVPKSYSASIILPFFETANHFLYRTYGTQYIKLRNSIITDWFPRLPASDPTTSSSKAMLEVYLRSVATKDDQAPAGSRLN
eukprot:TRINITY_DN2523_c0_g2_i5.p1 TRINITY_DN2523_c0_g2~~TRINITY_DN2523_c0_g2_i5.p1  ORF type:complete len:631 (-),score=121.06 TRINITY_DN2523_c0_g2_i5:27-1919(-)